jgi:hypothetical protein
MTLADLTNYWKRGMPVIVMVQEYGSRREGKAKFAYGHYLAVIGRDKGYVYVQDPSEDNIVRGEGSDNAMGRAMIRDGHFARIWHDRDADGRRYHHFGIAVGPPEPSMLATAPPELEHSAGDFQSALLLAYIDSLAEAEDGDPDNVRVANTLHEMLTGNNGRAKKTPIPEQTMPMDVAIDHAVKTQLGTHEIKAQLSTLAEQVDELRNAPISAELTTALSTLSGRVADAAAKTVPLDELRNLVAALERQASREQIIKVEMPTMQFTMPEIKIPEPAPVQVDVHVPAQHPPVINVESPKIPPIVIPKGRETPITFVRDSNGKIIGSVPGDPREQTE